MIYFNKEKEAFAFEIENPICVITEQLWEQYAGTDKWDIVDGQFIDITSTEEYKKKQEEKKKAKIQKLTCTKRVLVLLLQEYGIDYFQQVLPLIKANQQAMLEWELCVELERSNPLIDKIGGELGLTTEQIDKLFLYANGMVDKLIDSEVEDE